MSANDSAFPTPQETRSDGEILAWGTPGLTKREHFAVLLMPSLMAGQGFQQAARDAIKAADALLSELATANDGVAEQ